jgi:hypothetical protein
MMKEFLLVNKVTFIVKRSIFLRSVEKIKVLIKLKNLENSYVASDDLEVGIGNKIALWMFGFLY